MIKADLKLFSYGSRRDRERMIRQRETVTLQGYDRGWRRLGFSLVEILIVVAIIGILAAIVIPEFQQQTQLAKEAAAKENLQILRGAIERYALEHNGVPPGYPGNNLSLPPSDATLRIQLKGRYIRLYPTNPFNESKATLVLKTSSIPEKATGTYGWIYCPQTKKMKIDWPSTDSQGVKFYDY